MKTADLEYCMSSWLMYRTIYDRTKCFFDGISEYHIMPPARRIGVHNSSELESALNGVLADVISKRCGKPVALALSGGIDSAILAKMVPKGSVAYTFKCIVPGIDVVDETPQAARYAAECGIEHRIIEIYWEDMVKLAGKLMKHKGQPIHSIEVQIYKASLQALSDGFDSIVFGESADVQYGGMSGLLSCDWTFGDFVERYSYVMPYKVLKKYQLVTGPYEEYTQDGYANAHEFMRNVFFEESINSYANACETAGITCVMPFSKTFLAEPLDYMRIRGGENKYLVREVFNRLYPGWEIPTKTPMPRPLNEWMKNWAGPTRPEFWPHCTDTMTGDQKWYVYILEKFLDLIDN